MCQCAVFTHALPGHGLHLSGIRVWLYVLLGLFVLFMKVSEYLLFLFILKIVLSGGLAADDFHC